MLGVRGGGFRQFMRVGTGEFRVDSQGGSGCRRGRGRCCGSRVAILRGPLGGALGRRMLRTERPMLTVSLLPLGEHFRRLGRRGCKLRLFLGHGHSGGIQACLCFCFPGRWWRYYLGTRPGVELLVFGGRSLGIGRYRGRIDLLLWDQGLS